MLSWLFRISARRKGAKKRAKGTVQECSSCLVFLCVFAPLRKLKSCLTRAALFATSRVKSAACYTTNVHCSRKPTRDERARSQNSNQNQRVQQEVSQSMRLSLFRL